MKKLLVILYCTCLLNACNNRKPEATGLKGEPLPSFNLLLTDSISYFNTNSIPEGKPIVLFYFGPYCRYSRAQMDDIIKRMSLLKNIRLYIFTTHPFREMKDFYSYYHLEKYENITTGVDYSFYFPTYFNAKGVPYIAIYGKDKKLKESFIGKVLVSQIKQIADE